LAGSQGSGGLQIQNFQLGIGSFLIRKVNSNSSSKFTLRLKVNFPNFRKIRFFKGKKRIGIFSKIMLRKGENPNGLMGIFLEGFPEGRLIGRKGRLLRRALRGGGLFPTFRKRGEGLQQFF